MRIFQKRVCGKIPPDDGRLEGDNLRQSGIYVICVVRQVAPGVALVRPDLLYINTCNLLILTVLIKQIAGRNKKTEKPEREGPIRKGIWKWTSMIS